MFARFSRSVMAAAVLLVAKTAMSDPVDVQPSTVTIVYGRVFSGNIFSLQADDSNSIVISRTLVPNLTVEPIVFRVETSLPATPVSLSFHVLSRQGSAGQYQQYLNLYDWTKGLFEPLTNVTTWLSREWSDVECLAVGSADRFTRPLDNRVWALVRVKPLGLVPTLNWKIEYEKAWFSMTTGP